MPKFPGPSAQHRLLGLLRVASGRIGRDAADVEAALERGNCIDAVHFDSKMREDVGRVRGALEVLTPGSLHEHYTRFATSSRTHPRRFSRVPVLVSPKEEGRGMAAIDTANRLHDRVTRVCSVRR